VTTEHQNEDRELTDNEIDAITGGGYVHFVPKSGFGTRTDANIAFQNANRLSLSAFVEAPILP
jgi:hypothetical protein